MSNVTTIGFTKSTAESFFQRLKIAGISKLYDVRLHNTSQLSGFAKATDLSYFLKTIGNIEYVHQPLLAPTDTMLKRYKKDKGDWHVYQDAFLALMAERRIENRFNPSTMDGVCLLCSEDTPHKCHRRLICDYLNIKWGGALSVKHL